MVLPPRCLPCRWEAVVPCRRAPVRQSKVISRHPGAAMCRGVTFCSALARWVLPELPARAPPAACQETFGFCIRISICRMCAREAKLKAPRPKLHRLNFALDFTSNCDGCEMRTVEVGAEGMGWERGLSGLSGVIILSWWFLSPRVAACLSKATAIRGCSLWRDCVADLTCAMEVFLAFNEIIPLFSRRIIHT